jgi:ATP-dependent DNA helicase PIF1
MVDPDFLDALDVMARSLRDPNLPFGGIQVIAAGDFNQLPPIVFGEELRYAF